MSLKLIAFTSFALAVISYTYAQIAPGANTYLPPTKNGYNYPSPTVPFRPPPGGRPGPAPGRPGPAPGRPGPAPGRPAPGPAPGRPAPGPGPSRPGPQNPPPGAPGHVHEPGMPFDFQYDVKDAETANDYSHKANSDGDVTTGEYRVALPDGRTQVVRYTADWKTGYHADVSYEGEAQFPQGPSGPGGRPGGGGGGGAAGYKY